MPTTHKTNPSHGTKVTSDPATAHSPKPEFPGTVTKDSLAAESLRSEHGTFAAGNPVGITNVTGEHSTLAIDPEQSGAKYHVLHQRGKGEEDAGPPSSAAKGRSAHTGTAGGGSQAQEAFGTASTRQGPRSLSSDDARGSTHSAGSAGARARQMTGKVGATAEDVDWSKIPNETRMEADIGSQDDPGRLAEDRMRRAATRQGGVAAPGARTAGGRVSGEEENPYGALQSEETME